MELLKHALSLQAMFVQGELRARPGGGPRLGIAALPEFDPALMLGTLKATTTEDDYSA